MTKKMYTEKMVYSDSLEEMVIYGFTYRGDYYTWNDSDMLWWNDEDSEDAFMSVPVKAVIDLTLDYSRCERVEAMVDMCDRGDDFNWERYQQLCDIADYWGTEE